MNPRKTHASGTILTCVVLSLTVLWPPTVVQGFPIPSFQGLGDLPGGSFQSNAFGTSADGSVVVGQSQSASQPSGEAFRWTSGDGMVGLGDLVSTQLSSALATSADGAVAVGNGRSASGVEAFRWTSVGGMVGLGDLPGGGF